MDIKDIKRTALYLCIFQLVVSLSYWLTQWYF